jgi:hypothetical protein
MRDRKTFEEVTSMLLRLLEYKPGAAFYIIGGVLLLLAMALFTQYRMTGRVNLQALVDRDADRKPFWDRNPQLEFVDSYPHTSLVVVRDRATGRSGMLDLAMIVTAVVQPAPCDNSRELSEMIYSDAGESLCFTINKPDTGAGDPYTHGVSFSAEAKEGQVEQFYRNLFTRRGKQVSVMQNSSNGIILEAEDEHQNTVARISIRGSFDTAQGFLSWTNDFH